MRKSIYLLTTTPSSHTHRFHPLPLATPASCSPHPLATPIHSTHSPQLPSIRVWLLGVVVRRYIDFLILLILWSRMVDDLSKSLDIDKGEWLEDIERGDSSSASFLACVEECISERESRRFEEGLNTKVKLDIYKRFGKSVEFKKYLHGVCDAGSRLLFKFRSGTHGLNEELGRHRGREGKTECSLCGDECENVSHVLWDVQHIVVRVSYRGGGALGYPPPRSSFPPPQGELNTKSQRQVIVQDMKST